jgi:hypothetical protein
VIPAATAPGGAVITDLPGTPAAKCRPPNAEAVYAVAMSMPKRVSHPRGFTHDPVEGTVQRELDRRYWTGLGVEPRGEEPRPWWT